MSTIKLGDISKYAEGRISSSMLTVNNYVGTDNIRQNKSGKDNSQYVPITGQATAYQKGNILIANIRPYLKKIWFADNDGGSSADVSTISVNSGDYLSEFVYYNLFQDSFFDYAMMGAKGSKMPRLDKKQIMGFPIADIDLESQAGIVKTLSSIDKKIGLNTKISNDLESIAQLIYNQWFVQFDFPDVNNRPYKTAGGAMVYSEELKREIPAGWNVAPLGDFIEVLDSKRVPLSKRQRIDRAGQYPYYGATGIVDYIDNYIYDGEYILVAEDGSVEDEQGHIIVQYINGRVWVNNHAHVLRSLDGKNNEYLYRYLLNVPAIQITTGSIQKKITRDNLNNLKLIRPSDDSLAKFATLVLPIRNELIHSNKEKEALKNLRDWILPMLMNGQIVID